MALHSTTDPHPRHQSSRPLAQLASCSLFELAGAALANGKYSAAPGSIWYVFLYIHHHLNPFKFWRERVWTEDPDAPKRLANPPQLPAKVAQPRSRLLPHSPKQQRTRRPLTQHLAVSPTDPWHPTPFQPTPPTLQKGPANSDWASLRAKRPISMSITWWGLDNCDLT